MFRKLAGLTAVAGLFFAGSAFANISGSVHDFTTQIPSATELCAVCHTPHISDTTVTTAPLWDHELTTASYTAYSTGTLDGTWSAAGASRLCLSCHDGTIGVDAYGDAAAGGTATTQIDNATTWGTLVGTGMTDLNFQSEHPIGVLYSADSAGMQGSAPTNAAVQLFGGAVECMSCHDVHDQSGQANLLVMSNAASAMCTACHVK